MNQYDTWIGAVAKVDSALFVVGLQTISGYISRLDALGDPKSWWGCQALGVNLGPGLGASAGLSVVVIGQARNFWDVNGTDIGGFGLSLALEDRIGKIPPVGKEEYDIYVAMSKGVAAGAAANKYNALSNMASNALSLKDAVQGKPYGVIIDVPYAGVGLQASFVWTANYKLELIGL
jgi:hypothetical protein